KTGNSLISRFGLHTDIKTALRQSKWNIDTYKIAVETYKNAENKEQKREIKELIDTIKTEFRVYVSRTTPLYIALEKARTELYNLTKPQLFNFTENELGEWTKKVEKLTAELTIREQQFEDYKTGKNLIHAFEWRFEFPEALDDDGDFAGFDVVIGNPPYIQLQSMGAITDSYKQMNYQVFERTGDIYCLFYELGHKLLKQNGLLSFITSNKWMRAGYGEKTRKFFVENTNPTLLVDFAGVKVFDEATVDVNILMLQKDKNRQQTQACIVKKNGIKDLSVFVRQQSVIAGFDPQSPESSWVILSPIEQRIKAKIEAVGVPLKDWDIQINYGIKTGFNDAFIISGEKRKELIAEDPKSAEIIRPLLRGRDIKRYGYQFADLHLITTFPSLKIDIEKYPAVKQHLMSFGYDRLKQTGEEGARKKTNNQWFETQDSISYCEDFFKQKIMYPNMTKFLPFYFDNQSFFQNDKSFMIVGENIAYLTAILNSSLFKYCFSNNFPELQGGTRELRKIFFDKIPILYVDKETNKLFESKIMKIQDLKMQNIETKDKEIEIDNMIFDLYHLTEEEKTIIGFIEIQ
ncbi:MAG: Eco57I restriction-modification methylase domain-containing protein, partial [Prevotellaceae bacterium]|nr:Eco57I restriction-modification methylase domain-containing protein [Prevotellaceae bacterium]